MLIKKLISVFLMFFVFSGHVYAVSEADISAEGCVVIDADYSRVLFGKNEHKKQSMASTTKIMTALLAIESGKLHCSVTAARDIISDGTSIGIKKGDTFTLGTLVYAMMLESGNDAALLTAEYLSGSEEAFAVMMNDKAAEIGMKNTNFVTASGLDSPEHYSTAYDMALLSSYAVSNPVFRSICSEKSYEAHYIYPDISVRYSNHNKLLDIYDGVFGVKTGFTKKSGRCLVSACERDGRTLITVTLRAPDDWNDHIKLYDYYFGVDIGLNVNISEYDSATVYGGTKNCIALEFPETVCIADGMIYDIIIPKILYAPIMKGDVIGNVVIYSDNDEVTLLPIKSKEDVQIISCENYGFKFKLKYLIYKLLKG